MRFQRFTSRLQSKLRRAQLAWRFLRNRLTADDAQDLQMKIEYASGWFPLNTLCVEDVLSDEGCEWEITPALRDLAFEACHRVARKWDDGGDPTYHAQQRALEIISEMAIAEGIELIPAAA